MIEEIKKEIQRQLQESEERLSHIKARGMVAPNEEQLIVHLKGLLSFLDTLEVKEVNAWKTVDNINPPQADRNKIYCVFTKDRYILAKVINHPKDEELLQWKCTEFPFHRYDMCEGDKYMQIV